MEAWHRFLLSRLSLPPPPNFTKISMDQLLRRPCRVGEACRDDCAFLESRCRTLTRRSRPCRWTLRSSTILPHFWGCLYPKRGKSGGKDKKRFAQDSDTPDCKKGKGKGIPAPLQEAGLRHECSKTGSRWNYNLQDRGCKFAKAGEQCKRGLHLCMRCEQTRPLFECKAKAGS